MVGEDRNPPASKGFFRFENFVFITGAQGMTALLDTAVENRQEIEHTAPALSLSGAPELQPEPYK